MSNNLVKFSLNFNAFRARFPCFEASDTLSINRLSLVFTFFKDCDGMQARFQISISNCPKTGIISLFDLCLFVFRNRKCLATSLCKGSCVEGSFAKGTPKYGVTHRKPC